MRRQFTELGLPGIAHDQATRRQIAFSSPKALPCTAPPLVTGRNSGALL